MSPTMESSKERQFHITVLGRTLEHLGVQMYKRRDVAITELVANSWDAGATRVDISIPDEAGYVPNSSKIIVLDNGRGMTDDAVEDEYLVVGRNRRLSDDEVGLPRPVMGRKGIGKLAGFGLASMMSITTWTSNRSTQLSLDVNNLKADAGETRQIPILGIVGPRPPDLRGNSGTRIVLTQLKHKSPPDIDGLQESLAVDSVGVCGVK